MADGRKADVNVSYADSLEKDGRCRWQLHLKLRLTDNDSYRPLGLNGIGLAWTLPLSLLPVAL